METALTKLSRGDFATPAVYENGKVKRVLFDGGYATFSDTECLGGITSCATTRAVSAS